MFDFLQINGDPFRLFRYLLFLMGTVYLLVVTAQSLWGWYLWLAGGDRYTSLLRRYLLVHGLRLRFKAFWGDALICALLFAAFALLWRAQIVMDGIEKTVNSAHVQRASR